MSRRRVVTGADERGRPIATWEDSQDRTTWGHMEPAFDPRIERRQATPQELGEVVPLGERLDALLDAETEARLERARELSPVDHLVAGHHQEDPPMTETPHEAAPEPVSEPEPQDEVSPALWALRERAAAAEAAWTAKVAAAEAADVADARWEEARYMLERAAVSVWDILGLQGALARTLGVPEPAIVPAVGPVEVAIVDEAHVQAAPEPQPKRQPGRHPGKAQESREKAERARRVVEAMERLGGDQKAVAAELGMKSNAVAMVVKHARLRGELA